MKAEKIVNSKVYPWIVVALLWVVALLNYMDRQMLSTMRDAMQIDITDLESAVNFGRLMAIFLWIYGCVSPFAGAIADRINRKWLIVASLGVWSAVTLLMGYCTTFDQVYWLRALMGISEALYIPAALSLIADYFTGSSRSLAVGIHMTGLYLGQAVGGFGATLAAAYSWQATFHWFGIIGIVYALVLAVFLFEKRKLSGSGRTESRERTCLEKFRTCVFEHFFLGDSVFLRIVVTSRLVHQKLVADIVCGQSWNTDVSGRSDFDNHYRCRILCRCHPWRLVIRQMGEKECQRKNLYECNRSRINDTGLDFYRYWSRNRFCSRSRCMLWNRIRYVRYQ